MNEWTNDISVIKKDIEQQMAFSCSDDREHAWMDALALRINELILSDFQSLVNILYRLDVSESKLRQLLNAHSAEGYGDAGKIIAQAVFERQVQKRKTRQEYRRDPDNIDETEKW